MNSIFQLLLGMDEIREFFNSLDLSDSSESLLFHFNSFVQSYQSLENLIIPKLLVETSFTLFPLSKPYTQQDAQEYFYLLIDKLSSELNSRGESNLFEELFKGELITSIKCKQGKKIMKEEFLQLNLSIQNIDNDIKNKRTNEELNIIEQLTNSLFCKKFRNKDAYTVIDCIRQYMGNIENFLQETCFICEGKNSCKKRMELSKAPKYLNICLKRFSYLKKFSKLTTKVYAVESFEICGAQYELMTVVQHQSFFGRKHYKVFCKDKEDWLECNDSKVKKTNLENVQNSQPYILVYKKLPLKYSSLESEPCLPEANQAIPDGNHISNRSSQIHLSISSSRQSRSSLQFDPTKYHTCSENKSTNTVIPTLTTPYLPSSLKGYKTIS